MKLDRVAAAAGHFRCDNCGAGADEKMCAIPLALASYSTNQQRLCDNEL
jgi:hypothetical protein